MKRNEDIDFSHENQKTQKRKKKFRQVVKKRIIRYSYIVA